MESVGVVDSYKPKPYKKHKTTEEHFETYKAEIEKLWTMFQMSGISTFYQHTKIQARAAYKISSDMVVSYCLSTEWYQCEEPTNEDVKKSARHEFSHSLVGIIDLLAHDRHATAAALKMEFERFANIMEDFLTKLYEGRIEYK
jgi:hypothetical protein